MKRALIWTLVSLLLLAIVLIRAQKIYHASKGEVPLTTEPVPQAVSIPE